MGLSVAEPTDARCRKGGSGRGTAATHLILWRTRPLSNRSPTDADGIRRRAVGLPPGPRGLGDPSLEELQKAILVLQQPGRPGRRTDGFRLLVGEARHPVPLEGRLAVDPGRQQQGGRSLALGPAPRSGRDPEHGRESVPGRATRAGNRATRGSPPRRCRARRIQSVNDQHVPVRGLPGRQCGTEEAVPAGLVGRRPGAGRQLLPVGVAPGRHLARRVRCRSCSARTKAPPAAGHTGREAGSSLWTSPAGRMRGRGRPDRRPAVVSGLAGGVGRWPYLTGRTGDARTATPQRTHVRAGCRQDVRQAPGPGRLQLLRRLQRPRRHDPPG